MCLIVGTLLENLMMNNQYIMSVCGDNKHCDSLKRSHKIIEFDKKGLEDCSAFFVNCDNIQSVDDQALFDRISDQKKPVILSNPNLSSYKNPFKSSFVSLNAETAVHYPMNGYGVTRIPASSVHFKSVDSEDVKFIASDPVERIAYHLNMGIDGMAHSTPQNLPLDQYNFEYLILDLSGKIMSSWGEQDVSASIMYELCLMASFNPELKYLRCISMGKGINPSPMKYDKQDRRGFFTEIATAGITIKDNKSRINIREHSPPNANNVKNVTISSRITVGVNISKNPGFNASYTVITSETTPVSDFDIINDTKKDNTNWRWQLSLTRNGKEGLWDGDDIHEIPNLSKYNLQLPTLSTFQAGSTESSPFNESVSIGLKFSPTFKRAWIDSKCCSKQIKSDGIQLNVEPEVTIDFSKVNAF